MGLRVVTVIISCRICDLSEMNKFILITFVPVKTEENTIYGFSRYDIEGR